VEERERQDRFHRALFGADEEHQHHDGEDELGDDAGVGPAERGGVRECEQERDEAGDERGDAEPVDDALDAFGPFGPVLELAAGTGNLTARLAQHADRITAVDSSPEALALNEAKLRGQSVPVDYVVADVFSWDPPSRYDVVAFGFWLTHVPHARFGDFWQLVDRALVPGGRVFFVDNARPSASTVPSQVPREWFRGPVQDGVLSTTNLDTGVSVRRLLGGAAFRIVKQYWEPSPLVARLAELGWDAEVHETRWAFIHGSAQRRGERGAPG